MMMMMMIIINYVITCAARLTPLYMFVLAIYATLFKYFGSGPYWPQESDESCKNNWWTNLLYINNIVHTDKMVIQFRYIVLYMVIKNAAVPINQSTNQ